MFETAQGSIKWKGRSRSYQILSFSLNLSAFDGMESRNREWEIEFG